MTALVETRLAQIATELSGQHAACESALSDAVGHAIRAGELLLEAKPLVAHGAWGPWLAQHFAGSDRTAQGYMQLARETDPRRVAVSGVRAALAAIAEPAVTDDEEPEVVDGEVVDGEVEAEAPRSVVDMLRESGDLDEVERELEEEDRHREEEMRERFPRPGVERTTVRQIREAGRQAERALDATTSAGSQGMGDWSCGQGLDRVAAQHQEAADAARELAQTLNQRSRV